MSTTPVVGLCYSCGKRMSTTAHLVYTEDHQPQFVGPECSRRIRREGASGYQPPQGGPKLYAYRRLK